MNATKTILLIVFLILGVGLGCKKDLLKAKSGKQFVVDVVPSAATDYDIIERAIKITEVKLNAIRLDGEVTRDPDAPNKMLVKIYSSDDLEKAKKFLFTSYQLELKEVVSPANPSPMRVFPTQADAEKTVADDQEILPFSYKGENSFVIVRKAPIVTGESISNAQAIGNAGTEYYRISFNLNKDGAEKFGDWTGKSTGAYLGIVLDKKLVSAPYIKGQIFDAGQIDGKFTKEEADNIALSLKSGYLPATMKIVKEENFGN